MTSVQPYTNPPARDVLTSEEARRLRDLERVVQQGLETFYRVGKALMEIKESQLYRAGFPNFDAYCRAKWKMGRAYAYGLINTAEVMERLAGRFDVLPRNEAQVRPLLSLPPEKQLHAWDMALRTAGSSLTQAHVRSVVKTLCEAEQRSLPSGEIPPEPIAPRPPADGGVVAPRVMRFAEPEWSALQDLAHARRCSVYQVLKSLINDARRGH